MYQTYFSRICFVWVCIEFKSTGYLQKEVFQNDWRMVNMPVMKGKFDLINKITPVARNQHITLLKKDIKGWNNLRRHNFIKALHLIQTNQSVISLQELVWSEDFQNLVKVDLTNVNLQNSNLRGAYLGINRRFLYFLEKKGLGNGDLLELKSIMACLQKANLREADLTGADLFGADLTGANITGANLNKADLREAILIDAELIDVNFDYADLRRTCLRNAKLIGIPEWMMLKPDATIGSFKPQLKGTKLNEADFTETRLNGLDFRNVDLSNIKNFGGAKLIKADLSNAKLSGVNLREADLRYANLTDADLTGAKLNRISYSQAYPDKNIGSISKFASDPHGAADLRGANFKDAKIIDVDLSWMDLTNTNLAGANLTGSNLCGVNLTKKDLRKTNICYCDLSYTIMVQTDLRNANLKGCRVHGMAVWDVLMKNTTQSELLITMPDEPSITVDNIQMAQFIYLLTNRENFHDFIDTITSKVVLILGRFTPERKNILEAMSNELRKHNLLPIIFDFDRPASRNLTETIKILAGISLFIIADVTKPKSSPLEMEAIAPYYAIPIIPVLQAGEEQFSMLNDLLMYDWVLPLKMYSSIENLRREFKPKIIDRAWKKNKELQWKKALLYKKQSSHKY